MEKSTILTVDPIADITHGFKQGDRESFEYFVNTLTNQLIFHSRKIVKDTVIAEDVVSEAFMKIWDRRTSFSHSAVIKSWLYTTVTNTSINHLNSINRVEKAKKTASKELEYQSDLTEDIDKKERVASIRAFLDYLPKECKRIFQLLYIEGYTVREVAEELNLAITTVKNQKGRGLDIIRTKMNITIPEKPRSKPLVEEDIPIEIEEDITQYIMPKELTMGYLKKNAGLLKLVLPTLSPLHSYLTELYTSKSDSKIRRSKLITKSVTNTVRKNFNRTRTRVLRGIQERIDFFQKYPEISRQVLTAIVDSIRKLPRTDKVVFAGIMHDNSIQDIMRNKDLSERTVRNSMKNFISAVSSVYPHPDLLSRSIPIYDKMQRVLVNEDSTILRAIKKSGVLGTGSRRHGNADGKSDMIFNLHTQGRSFDEISAIVDLDPEKCKKRYYNQKYAKKK